MRPTPNPQAPVTAVQLRTRFGLVIRRRRLTAIVGQETLAERVRIHRTHLSLIERGKRTPTLYVVRPLARALGTTRVDLMGDVEAGELPGEEPPLPRGRPKKKGKSKR
jgi:transcriptional regulator with XRE-family HTH domain